MECVICTAVVACARHACFAPHLVVVSRMLQQGILAVGNSVVHTPRPHGMCSHTTLQHATQPAASNHAVSGADHMAFALRKTNLCYSSNVLVNLPLCPLRENETKKGFGAVCAIACS